MSFSNPTFLYAFSLLAIPIAIHLFNLRKFKKVAFSNVALLQWIKVTTQASSQLKNLLLLLCRILAFSMLILAFSEPGFKETPIRTSSTVGIAIDNSPSMSRKGSEGVLLQEAMVFARRIVEAQPENTSFVVQSIGGESMSKRVLSKSEAISVIEQLKPVKGSLTVSQMINKIKGISSDRAGSIYIISDFQKSTSALTSLRADSSLSCNLVPVTGAEGQNLAIDSAWFDSPTHLKGGEEHLGIRLRNYGGRDAETVGIRISVNNQPAALTSVEVPANGQVNTQVIFRNKSAGIQHMKISIDDASLIFDNDFYVSYVVNDKQRIYLLAANQAESPIGRLFESDSDYELQRFSPSSVNYQTLRNEGTLFVEGLPSLSSGLITIITEKLKRGHSVCLVPPRNADLRSYNQLMASVNAHRLSAPDTGLSRLQKLEVNHPFFKNLFDRVPQEIDLPTYSYLYAQDKALSQALLTTQSNQAFFSLTPVGEGSLFTLYSPLDDQSTNFAAHGLFTPLMLRVSENNGYRQVLYATAGQQDALRVGGSVLDKDPELSLIEVSSPNAVSHRPEVRRLPDAMQLFIGNLDLQAGNYELRDGANQTLMALGVNTPANESDIRGYTPEELEETAEKTGAFSVSDKSPEHLYASLQGQLNRAKLWPWFIAAALLFVVLEICITRWLK